MTQRELAERLNIPYPTFNGYVRGRHSISIDLVQRIADELGVSVFLLINREPLPADSQELTEEERVAVARYRLLTREQREMIVQNMELFIKQNRTKNG